MRDGSIGRICKENCCCRRGIKGEECGGRRGWRGLGEGWGVREDWRV